MPDMLGCALTSDGLSYFVASRSLDLPFRRHRMIIYFDVSVSIHCSSNSSVVDIRYLSDLGFLALLCRILVAHLRCC